jgi:mRNA-degrading endonuclease RelE of RelBE toxin-antitoxin system
MKVQVSKRFLSDFQEVKRKDITDIALFYVEFSEQVDAPEELPGFKYLKGYRGYGRISIEDYRMGVHIAGRTIKFLCLLHRSKIYEQFP